MKMEKLAEWVYYQTYYEEVKKKKKLAQKKLESDSKELRSRVQLLKRLFAVV